MTFFALLTKELRLRLRRERTIWIIIVYIFLMSLLGWFFISRSGSYNNGYGNGISQVGKQLYYLLSVVQLFLILFITPAFTATSINGEKERQTFDLLLCSRLSSFSLISGKLVAGLVNAFLLIAASIPLFSLVFFFGGVAPYQVLLGLLIYIVTAIMVGTFGLLCSTFLARPAVSTALTYLAIIIWIITPVVVSYILAIAQRYQGQQNSQGLFYAWNPVAALISTYPDGTGITVVIGSKTLAVWLTYLLISVVATVVFFVVSIAVVRPNSPIRFSRQQNRPPTAIPTKTSIIA